MKMNWKKKIILVSILVIVLCIGMICIKVHNVKENNKFYNGIKDNIDKDIEKYLKISSPYCSIDSATFVMDEDVLVVQAGIDKEKLRDIDGNSYCKVKVEVRCVAENKHDWDTYLKCSNYVDKEYNR